MEAERIKDAKDRLIKSGNNTLEQKKKAKEEYDKQVEFGFVESNTSFEQWVSQNYPALTAGYQDYAAANGAYTQTLMQFDQQAGQAWQQKLRDNQRELLKSQDSYEKAFSVVLPDN
ncbi:hypothetical protein F53441_10663 [Fusarium austroafricanum]|uniref:Uncharacterized protein n=1 Tax=Fusarium austroafricanum TaxID=2364996 RepID=A0A8H4KAT9_9HYPO|nr:hypothetical protein F53441_10663 [Fusarium austroafricanum]